MYEKTPFRAIVVPSWRGRRAISNRLLCAYGTSSTFSSIPLDGKAPSTVLIARESFLAALYLNCALGPHTIHPLSSTFMPRHQTFSSLAPTTSTLASGIFVVAPSFVRGLSDSLPAPMSSDLAVRACVRCCNYWGDGEV